MFHFGKIKKTANDSKKMWDIIKDLTGNFKNKK